MTNIIEDLSLLTSIDTYNLNKLRDTIISVISHSVVEGIKNKDKIIEIDTGIGILRILNETDVIKYKFIPSNKLEKIIKKSYEGKSDLIKRADENVGRRILNAYEELL